MLLLFSNNGCLNNLSHKGTRDTECTLEFSKYDMLALGAAEQAVIGLVISWGRKWGVKYAKVND